MRLLLIEDDEMIGKAMQRGLTDAGFAVDWAHDGRTAELALENDVYQIAILDLGLPKKEGMDILRDLRHRDNSIPVIIVSARDTVSDRIAGLQAGADDYLLKPFDFNELVARIHALIRRNAGSGSPILKVGRLTLDSARKAVTCDGKQVDVSAREFSLLEVLMRRPGFVLSREALEESLYGWDREIGSNAVEVHLHYLRKKLGTAVIQNVRGVGYRIAESS